MKIFALTCALLCSISIFNFYGCSQDSSPTAPPKSTKPSASFVMDKTAAEVGEAIQLTNQSTNATSYRWKFGDGDSSTVENPTHAYSSDGNFTITLTATGQGGADSATNSVTITALPLLGKWKIVEGAYNGNSINNLTGSFEIISDTQYKANFSNGSHSGSVTAKYTLSGKTFNSNINGNALILNGLSSESTCCPFKIIWSANLSSSRTVFNQWGATAIGFGGPTVEIINNQLVVSSSNGKAIIKYEK